MWFGPFVYDDLTKAQFGYPQVLTQVSSTYLNQGLAAVPLYELSAFLSSSSIQRLATTGDTGDLLSVETVIVFEIGGGEVQQDTDLIRSEVGSVVQ